MTSLSPTHLHMAQSNITPITYLLLFFFLASPLAHAAVTITLSITVQHPTLTTSPKANLTDVWDMMYVGLYSLSSAKLNMMKFAVQYINSQYDILSNIRLEIHGLNTFTSQATTIQAAFAGYASVKAKGFIGAESYGDIIPLQYIAGTYFVPQLNPTVVNQQLSDPATYRSLISVIPGSGDQQMIVISIMKKLDIKSALVISTDDTYGLEFSQMNFNVVAIALNMTFYNVILGNDENDFDRKLEIVRTQMQFYRYVIMHCTAKTGYDFLKKLGDNNLIGPQYLYILTHAMTIAMQESYVSGTSYAPYMKYADGAIGINARYNSNTPFAQQMRALWNETTLVDYGPYAKADVKTAWYAFDCVYAYALALDKLLKNYTVPELSGELYYNTLLDLDFDGATGRVNFNKTAARRYGLWDVVNFVFNSSSPVTPPPVLYTQNAIVDGRSNTSELNLLMPFAFFGGNTTVPAPYIAPVPPPLIRDFMPGLSAALGAVVGLALIVTIFASVMLFMFWPNFAKHGSFYSAVIILGAFFSLSSALMLLPKPTDGLCLAFPWLLGVGFSLVYGCLFIKTWTLYKVWLDAENFKKTNLSPYTILRGIGINVVLEIIVLVIWSAVDRPKAKYHKMVDDYEMLTCKTEQPTFWAIFIGIKGLWLIFGAILSILTRRVAVEYNQSSSIAYAIYNIAALLIIGIPLAISLEDIPGGRLIIEVAVIVIAFTFTIVCLFFSVWYRVFVPMEDVIGGVTVSGSRSPSSGSMRTGSSAGPRSGTRSGSGSGSGSGSHNQRSSADSKDEKDTSSSA